MSQLGSQTRTTLRTRICLDCGYAGPELQRRDEAAVWDCPCCGADLYARRPMSYAEMEGLIPSHASSRLRVGLAAGTLPITGHPHRVGLWRRLLSRLWLRG